MPSGRKAHERSASARKSERGLLFWPNEQPCNAPLLLNEILILDAIPDKTTEVVVTKIFTPITLEPALPPDPSPADHGSLVTWGHYAK